MERFAHTCVSGPFRGCRGRCAPEALHIVCSCDRRDDRKIFISSTMRAEGLDTQAAAKRSNKVSTTVTETAAAFMACGRSSRSRWRRPMRARMRYRRPYTGSGTCSRQATGMRRSEQVRRGPSRGRPRVPGDYRRAPVRTVRQCGRPTASVDQCTWDPAPGLGDSDSELRLGRRG